MSVWLREETQLEVPSDSPRPKWWTFPSVLIRPGHGVCHVCRLVKRYCQKRTLKVTLCPFLSSS